MSLSHEKIAFIQANWHQEIVGNGRESFIAELEKNGIPKNNVEIFDVPGSLEIPLQAQMLAKTGKYSLIACAGFVVNGGIYRHDFVASTVIDGIMRVSLDNSIPVLSMILTPLNFHEHDVHQNFFHTHFKTKGTELAHAAVAMLKNMQAVKPQLKAA